MSVGAIRLYHVQITPTDVLKKKAGWTHRNRLTVKIVGTQKE